MVGATMLLTQVADCQKDLYFGPLQPWPEALPAMAWGSQLLTGFDRTQGPALDLSQGGASEASFLKALVACYPSLTLPELARIYQSWIVLDKTSELEGFSWHEFFAFYSFRDSEVFRQTLLGLAQMPDDFQNWVSEKSLGTKDLAILRSFKDVKDLEPAALWLITHKASKSTGVQILETAGELRLMDYDWEKILPDEEITPEQWLVRLKSQRYPMNEARLLDKNKKLMQLPWPAHTQARWSRLGDETGLEIRFQVRSLSDFQKKLAGLEKMQEPLKDSTEVLWSK